MKAHGIYESSSGPCGVNPHKECPQQPTHKHPQPMFLPQCERPIFTSIQNNRQTYSSVYRNL